MIALLPHWRRHPQGPRKTVQVSRALWQRRSVDCASLFMHGLCDFSRKNVVPATGNEQEVLQPTKWDWRVLRADISHSSFALRTRQLVVVIVFFGHATNERAVVIRARRIKLVVTKLGASSTKAAENRGVSNTSAPHRDWYSSSTPP